MSKTSAVVGLFVITLCVAFGASLARAIIVERRVQEIQDNAMPCYETEVLVWKHYPDTASCIRLEELLKSALDNEFEMRR